MADTLWLEPGEGWTLADYLVITYFLLPDFLWPTLRRASNERASFEFLEHEGGYPAFEEFPEFTELNALSNLGEDTAIQRIINSVLISDELHPMRTDTFKEGVFHDSNLNNPKTISLSNLLTDVLGYPSGNLLIDSDSNNGGRNCLMRTSQLKQLYEVMNYQDYYGINVASTLRHIESSQIPQAPRSDADYDAGPIYIEINYLYTDTEFQSATAEVVTSGSIVEVYQPGDLNENPPFSTFEEIRTYAIGLMDSYKASYVENVFPAQVITNVDVIAGLSSQFSTTGFGPSAVHKKRLDLDFSSHRFKIAPINRPENGEFFDVGVWWNGYHVISNSDFGTGKIANLIENTEFIKQPDGYYYIDIGADYTVPPLAVETPGSLVSSSMRRQSYNWSSFFGLASGIFLRPNNPNGSADTEPDKNFLYYTP